MAVLTAYSCRILERRTDNERAMGDLLGGGAGPSLADVLREVLRNGRELPEPSAPEEPRREVYWTVDGDLSSTIDGVEHRTVLWGRVVQTKDEPALTKTRRATGATYDFYEGDPGKRPLFFLVSAPLESRQALVIAERAGSYTQTAFWRHEVKREIQALVTRPLKSDPSRDGPAVTVEFARFGDLSPGEYYEQHGEAVLEARATNYISEGGERVGQSQMRLVMRQQPQKSVLRRLMDRSDNEELAETLFAGFVPLPSAPPDEFEIVADIHGRPQVITINRDRIGYLGKKVPRNARRAGRFVDPAYLLDLATDWAAEIGHRREWNTT